jgi:predicted  nucleic acid-binding Zn-ribbon protein
LKQSGEAAVAAFGQARTEDDTEVYKIRITRRCGGCHLKIKQSEEILVRRGIDIEQCCIKYLLCNSTWIDKEEGTHKSD